MAEREEGATDRVEVLWEAIRDRRSMGVSRLKPDAVDHRLIERMLEAANWAPSHGDTEPWRFTVFMGDGREALAKIFEAAQGPHGAEGARKRAFAAPVWISIGMVPALKEDGSLRMTEDEELMAVACAVQNLHLMASALGIAGMWHSKGSSIHPEVARGLGLEAPARLLGFFQCGWPATDWLTSSRRPLSEKVRWEVDAPKE
jgi:nitroreductase